MTGYNIPPREYAEWANFWFEQGSDFEKARVMLIGDSITNGYRRTVQELVRDKDIYVDMAVGSRCAGDPALDAEIECCLGRANGYDYKVIHFNNGLHGMGLSDEDFDKYYEEVICHILEKYPPQKLTLMTVTPLTKNGDTSVFRNEKVDARNITVQRVAKKYGLAVDDLYSVVMGKSDIRALDGYHYTVDGYVILGRAMADFVLDNLK